MSVFYEILKIEYILNELKTEINTLNDNFLFFNLIFFEFHIYKRGFDE